MINLSFEYAQLVLKNIKYVIVGAGIQKRWVVTDFKVVYCLNIGQRNVSCSRLQGQDEKRPLSLFCPLSYTFLQIASFPYFLQIPYFPLLQFDLAAKCSDQWNSTETGHALVMQKMFGVLKSWPMGLGCWQHDVAMSVRSWLLPSGWWLFCCLLVYRIQIPAPLFSAAAEPSIQRWVHSFVDRRQRTPKMFYLVDFLSVLLCEIFFKIFLPVPEILLHIRRGLV